MINRLSMCFYSVVPATKDGIAAETVGFNVEGEAFEVKGFSHGSIHLKIACRNRYLDAYRTHNLNFSVYEESDTHSSSKQSHSVVF